MKVYQETLLFIILVFLIVMFATALIQRLGIKNEILKNQEILREIKRYQHSKE